MKKSMMMLGLGCFGGLAILFGNLAPRGAVVKEGAVLPQMLRHRGPAQVFDDEASAVEAIARSLGDVTVDELLSLARDQH